MRLAQRRVELQRLAVGTLRRRAVVCGLGLVQAAAGEAPVRLGQVERDQRMRLALVPGNARERGRGFVLGDLGQQLGDLGTDFPPCVGGRQAAADQQ